jgi:hypothetical protein
MDTNIKEQLDQHFVGLQRWTPEAILFPCGDNGNMIEYSALCWRQFTKDKR